VDYAEANRIAGFENADGFRWYHDEAHLGDM
jgi:hypothetical protein